MLRKSLFSVAFLAAALPLSAQVNLDVWTIDMLEASEIQTLASAPTTSALDGIALGPANTLILVHLDANGDETIVKAAKDGSSSTVLRNHAQLKTDLGVTGSIILEAGFDTSPTRDTVYFAYSDSADVNGIISIARLSTLTPGAAVDIISGSDLDDLSDFAVLPNGWIAGVRGSDGIGVIDPTASTPTWVTKVTEATLQGLLSTSSIVPVEAIGIRASDGRAYVFAHEVDELFQVDDLDTTATAARLAIPEWTNIVDLHDIVVDGNGIVYGFDEAGEAIVAWNGTASYSVTLEELAEAVEELEGAKDGSGEGLAPVLWRGFAASAGSQTKGVPMNSPLHIAIADDDHGVITINFGQAPAGPLSTSNQWMSYE
jgi:hypothetical protein